MLHVAVHTDAPLFKFTHDSLLVFGCNTRDIGLGASILKADDIAIFRPYLLYALLQLHGLDLIILWLGLVFEIVHRFQVGLPCCEILVLSALELYFSKKLNDGLDCSEAHFGLSDIGAIQAVNAVGAEHTSLVLQDPSLVVSFRHIVTELVLNVTDFVY